MRRALKFAITSGLLVTLPFSAPAGAIELAPQVSAESLLGADVTGDSWTVAPLVRSDGAAWVFTVKTSYGDFQVNGLHRMRDRMQELRALKVLEKMSRTKAFTGATVRAGLAPIRFGHDLIVSPFATVGHFVSGVGKTLNTVAASAKNPGGGRDPFFDSVTGITKVERDLALKLRVDPYSDFAPLRSGLEDVARVTTAGSLPVTAGIAMISGGAGLAVSSASTASQVSAVVYSHTSRELFEIITKMLRSLNVSAAITKKFVDNTFYSPADEYAIVEALKALGAANSTAFIENAATAASFDVAKFNRYRAELLARESARLGTLQSYVLVSGYVLNRDASGRLVAAFPFDTLSWTDAMSQDFTRVSAEVAAQHETRPPLFASAGAFSPSAQSELKKLGWETQKLD
jgi:hypothetical protein